MPVIDLELVAGLALSAAIITQGLRSVWPITLLVAKEVRPFACDLCMSIWSTLIVGALYLIRCPRLPEDPFTFFIEAVLPAMGGALVAITMTSRPAFPDPPTSSDDFSGEEKGP